MEKTWNSYDLSRWIYEENAPWPPLGITVQSIEAGYRHLLIVLGSRLTILYCSVIISFAEVVTDISGTHFSFLTAITLISPLEAGCVNIVQYKFHCRCEISLISDFDV